MISADQIKQPGAAYKKLQAELNEVLSKDHHGNSYVPLQQQLEKLFKEAFGLKDSYTAGAVRVYDQLKQATNSYSSVFDHPRYYKSCGQVVLVVQPYGALKEKLSFVHQLECWGVEVVNLESWSFYWPTQARCFGLVISKRANELIKVLSTAEGSYASAIFECLVMR